MQNLRIQKKNMFWVIIPTIVISFGQLYESFVFKTVQSWLRNTVEMLSKLDKTALSMTNFRNMNIYFYI